jgi:two-component system, chemotaxis family, chemotaxis protein CheY
MARHIMTVDDSKTTRDMATFTLRGAGFQVSEAEDGQKALQVLKTLTVDLVITDLNMPKLDGVGLIRALRADPKHRSVPILMLTTESDPAKKAAGRGAGATGWLVKPFNPEKLVELIHRVCG